MAHAEVGALEKDKFSFIPSPCAASAKTSKALKVFDDDDNGAALDLSEQERLDDSLLVVTKICFRGQR